MCWLQQLLHVQWYATAGCLLQRVVPMCLPRVQVLVAVLEHTPSRAELVSMQEELVSACVSLISAHKACCNFLFLCPMSWHELCQLLCTCAQGPVSVHNVHQLVPLCRFLQKKSSMFLLLLFSCRWASQWLQA